MGQRAIYVAILFGSACSILYNPDKIHGTSRDASLADVTPDVDVNGLVLGSAEPAQVYEGQGSDGSRMAVLVVHGQNIAPDATIAITAADGSSSPMVMAVGSAAVSKDHTMIAVPIEADVNTSCDTGTIPLTITVTQAGGTVSQPTPTAWKLQCLPQVDQTAGSGSATDLVVPTGVQDEYAYSRIVLTDGHTIVAKDDAAPVIVRVTGKIAVAGDIDVSASGSNGGPGGSGAGMGAGHGGSGGSAILGSGGILSAGGGGGAGYAGPGSDGDGHDNSGGSAVGSDTIPLFSSNYASGGGYYDNKPGGGGGGTIELTAGGSLEVHAITATGAQATGNGAGGGAGGTIVLRGEAGVILDKDLDVDGGAGGAAGLGAAGGHGAPGRIRINSPSALTGSGSAGTYYPGLAFDTAASNAPYVTNESSPQILVHGKAGRTFMVYALDAARAMSSSTITSTLLTTTTTVAPDLAPGFNYVCVVEPEGNIIDLEGVTCIELAYIPQ